MAARRARLVVLEKRKKAAPDFHRHIARSKLVGQVVQSGQDVLIYRIVETDPEGPVLVDADTELIFR